MPSRHESEFVQQYLATDHAEFVLQPLHKDVARMFRVVRRGIEHSEKGVTTAQNIPRLEQVYQLFGEGGRTLLRRAPQRDLLPSLNLKQLTNNPKRCVLR
jgi:hypothetical protein